MNYPWSANVYIESLFPDGRTYAGSGAMIGPNDVLTASHLVYRSAAGGVAERVRVYPARDGSDTPLGHHDAGHVNYFTIDEDGDGWITRQEAEYDVALLGLGATPGAETGYFELAPYGASGYYNLSGYPDHAYDSSGPRLYSDRGYATANSSAYVYDLGEITTGSGGSGGPLWYESDDGGAHLAGILSTTGWAADIFPQYSRLEYWMEANDFLLPGNHSIPPSPYFDEVFYLEENVERLNAAAYQQRANWTAKEIRQLIAESRFETPRQHFDSFGFKYGMSPSAGFDMDTYLEANVIRINRMNEGTGHRNRTDWTKSEVAELFTEAGIDPITHYDMFGDSLEMAESLSEAGFTAVSLAAQTGGALSRTLSAPVTTTICPDDHLAHGEEEITLLGLAEGGEGWETALV